LSREQCTSHFFDDNFSLCDSQGAIVRAYAGASLFAVKI
jgi:hypothetical protein